MEFNRRQLLLAEIPELPREAFVRNGRRYSLRVYKKGADQEGMNEAAKMTAEIAKEVWQNYKDIYQPIEKQYVTDAQSYDTPERRAIEEGKAAATVAEQFEKNRQAAVRQLQSYGVNPNDGKFRDLNNRMRLQQSGAEAAAQNMAREGVEQKGWARRTDALSLGKGLPAQASAAASQSGQLYGKAAEAQMAEQKQQQDAIGSIIGGGMSFGKDMGWFGVADGGYINARRQAIEQGFAMGGPAELDKLLQNVNQSAGARPQGVPPMSGLRHGIQAYRTGKNAIDLGIKGFNRLTGTQAPAPVVEAVPTPVLGVETAPAATQAAPAAVDAALATGEGAALGAEALAAGAAGTEAALAGSALGAEALGAAGTAAAGTAAGTAAAGGTAAAAAAPALAAAGPIGWAALAGLALTQMFGADGGRVDGTKGGKVAGPGDDTSDSIPARLSDGEYVLNAEAVRHFGTSKLDAMNRKGLEIRRQRAIEGG